MYWTLRWGVMQYVQKFCRRCQENLVQIYLYFSLVFSPHWLVQDCSVSRDLRRKGGMSSYIDVKKPIPWSIWPMTRDKERWPPAEYIQQEGQPFCITSEEINIKNKEKKNFTFGNHPESFPVYSYLFFIQLYHPQAHLNLMRQSHQDHCMQFFSRHCFRQFSPHYSAQSSTSTMSNFYMYTKQTSTMQWRVLVPLYYSTYLSHATLPTMLHCTLYSAPFTYC